MDNFFSYEFLQRAFYMAVLGGTVCGIMGVFVVLWRMSLIGMCITHASFAGALLGLLTGISPLLGGVCGSLFAATCVGSLANKPGFSIDTAMGVIFSVAMSIAILSLGLLPGAQIEGLNLIWGSLLTVTWYEVFYMLLISIILISFVFIMFKEIQAIMGQSQAAFASGIPVVQIRKIILILMALVVAFTLKAIGGLLIFALIVTPAAIALQLTYDLKMMFFLSCILGAGASVIGLWLSFYFSVPPGASIVLVATFLLIPALIFSPKKKYLN